MVAITKKNEIIIFANPSELFQFAAKDFARRAIATVNIKGSFSVVLSGGDTPKEFFDTLTQNEDYRNNIPWQKLRFFFGDERYVPSNNVENNYHMAAAHLFSKVAIKPANVYRIPTEFNDPKEAATAYEQTLRKVFCIADSSFPPFDLLYLGLGANAHTASLMPSSDIVKDSLDNSLTAKPNQLVAALFIPETNSYRITLTPKAINHAADIIFLVTGTNKAMALSQVLQGPQDPLHYPAQLIHCVAGKTIWCLDKAAAVKIKVAK